METNPTLLCIALPSWEGDYAKSTVELMSAMAATHTVYYVDYTYTWKDVWKAILGQKKHVPLRRILNPFKRVTPKKTRQGDPIQLVTLWPFIPANGIRSKSIYQFVMHVNAQLAIATLRKTIKRHSLANVHVINAFQPALGNQMLGKLGEIKHYYYCYDEISAAKWAGKHGNEEEKKFMLRVDSVIVSSEALFKSKSNYNTTFLLKNGVDFNLFRSAYTPKSKKNRTTIGYIGSIDDRLDYALIRSVMVKFPSISMVMIGRVVSTQVYELEKEFSQLELKGSFSPEVLPQQMAEMDIAIIPFVSNEFTKNIYPLKINEYLAAGIPVVSTHFGLLEEFRPVANICDSEIDFLASIQSIIESTIPHDPSQGWIFAQKNDWHERAEQLKSILQK